MTNPNPVAPKTDWVKKDREEGQRYLDWFIGEINADHDDRITVSRDMGCLMRDEIERLRKAERVAPKTDTPATQIPEVSIQIVRSLSRSQLEEIALGAAIRVASLESTLAAERASRKQAEEAFHAAERLYVGRYMAWSEAGGPQECLHGVAKGIACRRCDHGIVRGYLASKPSVSPANRQRRGSERN